MITLQNLHFSYKKKEPLFRNLNLDILSGNIYGLLGKNGAGKTSLLKIISGLRKIDNGTCNVIGHNPFNRDKAFLEQIFFVPEEIYVSNCSIKDYLKRYSGFYPYFSNSNLQDYLLSFELDNTMNLQQISYGQRKKFVIAFAMAAGTKLVLFDEPTNGLDIPSKSTFRKLIASAVTNEKTFIISTHQVRDLNMLIDNVILLDNGYIKLSNSIQQIAKKYKFVTISKEDTDNHIIHSEQHLEGFKAIIPNKSGIESAVDLELLFNAVILNKIQS